MSKQRGTVLSIVAAVMVGGMPGVAVHAASNSDQVVFSGIDSCGRYETDCNGALYFYARGIVVHVVGEITEPEEGKYEMDLQTTDGAIACTLINVPPIKHGPRNTVTGACTVNGAEVTDLKSLDAVVNATGP